VAVTTVAVTMVAVVAVVVITCCGDSSKRSSGEKALHIGFV